MKFPFCHGGLLASAFSSDSHVISLVFGPFPTVNDLFGFISFYLLFSLGD